MEKILIGLTGGIGAGKSEAAKILEELGAVVISGDELGREAMENEAGMLQWVRENFGDEVFDAEGRLLRKKLGDIVFSDRGKKKLLDEKIFPAIYRRMKANIEQAFMTHNVVVVDAAMIFEWGIEDDFDVILAVTAPVDMVRERLSRRDRFEPDKTEMRIKSQIPAELKAEKSDYTIINEGSLQELKWNVEEFWREKVKKG